MLVCFALAVKYNAPRHHFRHFRADCDNIAPLVSR